MQENRKGNRKRVPHSYYRAVMSLATIPFFLGVAPVIGWLIGRWVDGKAGTDPVFQAVGVAFGIAAAIRETVRVVRRAQRDLDR